MLIIGVKNVKGEFEGRAYNNYVCYCDDEKAKGVIFGSCPVTVKVKASVIDEFGLENLQGANVEFFYNKYGQVTHIQEI